MYTVYTVITIYVHCIYRYNHICTDFSRQWCMHFSPLLPLLQMYRVCILNNGCIWPFSVSLVHRNEPFGEFFLIVDVVCSKNYSSFSKYFVCFLT